MTRPFTRPRTAIVGRIRHLQQKINDAVGYRDQRLQFRMTQSRSGPTHWILRNERIEGGALTLAPGLAAAGVVAELAEAGDDGSILYFGYNEEWQPAATDDDIEFVSSNLRFAIAGVEDMPELLFRLEWAGIRTEADKVGYPGKGAAQPHWHFHVDDGWLSMTRAAAAPSELVEIDLEPAVEEVDLENGPAGVTVAAPPAPPQRLSATLAAFHHLHLPARTMWHEMLCEMPDIATPQQHTPGSELEIDRWVISALRYLRSEFEHYLGG